MPTVLVLHEFEDVGHRRTVPKRAELWGEFLDEAER